MSLFSSCFRHYSILGNPYQNHSISASPHGIFSPSVDKECAINGGKELSVVDELQKNKDESIIDDIVSQVRSIHLSCSLYQSIIYKEESNQSILFIGWKMAFIVLQYYY